MTSPKPAWLPKHRDLWPAEALYLFRERAAIREIDGGQERDVAEREAEREVRESWGRMER